MNLFDDDEPATKPLTRESLHAAYMKELEERPPTNYFRGEDQQAQRARRLAADRDIARIYRAAERHLGATLQIVPLPPKR